MYRWVIDMARKSNTFAWGLTGVGILVMIGIYLW